MEFDVDPKDFENQVNTRHLTDRKNQYLSEVKQRLSFVVSILCLGAGKLTNELWNSFVANALPSQERQEGFKAFGEMAEHVSKRRTLFTKRVLQVSILVMPEEAFECFERFFVSVCCDVERGQPALHGSQQRRSARTQVSVGHGVRRKAGTGALKVHRSHRQHLTRRRRRGACHCQDTGDGENLDAVEIEQQTALQAARDQLTETLRRL